MKKGFTLIELLAVIIILAVIALIATPVVLKVVDNAKVSAFKNTAYGLIDAGGLNYKESILNGPYSGIYVEFLDGEIISSDTISVSGKLPDNGDMQVNNKGEVEIAIYSDSLKKCAYKKYTDLKVTVDERDKEDCNISSISEEVATDSSCFTFDTSTNTITNYNQDCGTSVVIPKFITINGTNYNVENIGPYAFTIHNEILVSYEDDNQNYYELPYDVATANNINYVESWSIISNESTAKYCHNINTDKYEEVSSNTIYTIDDGYDECYFDNYDNSYGNIVSVDSSNTSYLKTIGNSAFENNKLTNAKISGSVTSIGNYSFDKNQLISVIIPDDVISIGDSAFRENLLNDVTLGKSLISIGKYAFIKESREETTNPNLTTIYNNSGNTFDWSSITNSSIAGQNFVTGIITHQSGDITVEPYESNLLIDKLLDDSSSGIYNTGYSNVETTGQFTDMAYYYRGSSLKNYISFNSETYRIVSITGNGIKIVKLSDDTQPFINGSIFDNLISLNNSLLDSLASQESFRIVNNSAITDYSPLYILSSTNNFENFAGQDLAQYKYSDYDTDSSASGKNIYSSLSVRDYLLSSNNSACYLNTDSDEIINYLNSCSTDNWILNMGNNFWLDSVIYTSGTSQLNPLYINSSSQGNYDAFDSEHNYFKTVYLNVNAQYVSGDGSETNPYQYN